MAGQHYCLRWDNYQSNMTSVFHQLLQNEAFVDVTLACNEASLKAHKVVLSACSSYFQKLLLSNPCTHPTIIMPQDVCFNDLKFIIEFVYKGEIDVTQAELQSLLRTADQLKIKGLCEVSAETGGGDVIGPSAVSLSTPPADYLPHHRPHHHHHRASSPYRHRSSGGRREGSAAGGGSLSTPRLNWTKFGKHRRSSPSYKRSSTRKSSAASQAAASSSFLQPQPAHEATSRAAARHPRHIAYNYYHHSQLDTKAKYKQEEEDDDEDDEEVYARLCAKENRQDCWSGNDEDDECMDTTGRANVPAAASTPLVVLDSSPSIINNNNNINKSNNNNNNNNNEKKLTTTNGAAAGAADRPDDSNRRNSSNSSSSGGSSGASPSSANNNAATKTSNNGDMFCHTGLGHYGHHTDPGEVDLPPETQPTPPSATLVGTTTTHLRDPDNHTTDIQNCDNDVKVKFETLQTMDSSDTIDIDSHMSDRASVSSKADDNMMMITPELLGLMPSGSSIHSDSPGGENNSRNHSQSGSHHHGSKSWTQEDMDAALEALRNHDMSLTKASATFGIPSTTLWQRAHRLGIDTPKKDGPTKSWSDESLNNALEALRTGTISANKASKAFGIPSSTLYKIARREGIRLAAPFNASPTAWSPADLDRALEAIRSGQTSVQRASTEFGIPTGTLYGRCKREGIELSRSNPTPWSEDAMTDALEAVRLGHMSINQAAIHYNLPYSSLYGRFKRGKYEEPVMSQNEMSQDGSSQHFHHPSPTQNNHTSPLPEQMTYQGS
ncbi:hypothetical protein TKK_0011273 [Trichogramma kaykai]|uniref:BTB domain-containing protein n=1 Tax=Trichogramma kaykai TaxID=54128 RepID=A0ABD2WTS3_9HYME